MCSFLLGWWLRSAQMKQIETKLSVVYNTEAHMITVYTYYMNSKAERLKNGYQYNFTTDLSFAEKSFYKDGYVVPEKA
jgi:hypothetical protein